jgi:hypothetical protein
VVDFVSSQPIGRKVKVDFMRNGRRGSVEVNLGELPSPEAGVGPEGQRLGVALQTLTEPLARMLGIDPRVKGRGGDGPQLRRARGTGRHPGRRRHFAR